MSQVAASCFWHRPPWMFRSAWRSCRGLLKLSMRDPGTTQTGCLGRSVGHVERRPEGPPLSSDALLFIHPGGA